VKDFNKLAQLMKIVVEDYEHEISLQLSSGTTPIIYIKNELTTDPGFYFNPGFSIDEVEGLVDFVYEIINVLDNSDPLDVVGRHKRITLVKWKK